MQVGAVDHFILIYKRAYARLCIGLAIKLQDFLRARQFFWSGRKHSVDDRDLIGMDGPLAIETHARSFAGIVLALLQITELQGYAVNHIKPRGPRSSHGLGLGIMVKSKLLPNRLPRTDVPAIVSHAKDQ